MTTVTIGKPAVGLDPAARKFLDKINSAHGPPIYEMPVDRARAVLRKLQDTPVDKPPAEIEDLEVPGGPAGRVRIRLVRPERGGATLPVVLYLHGGGWVLGDRDTHDRLVRAIANQARAVVAFVEYAPSPEARYPVALEEAYRALEYVYGEGLDLGLDPDRLAVAGDSVGGNMTAALALLAHKRRGPQIGCAVMFYPVTDAGFDTPSYRQFADGYWLSREAMKWFWDQYLPDRAARLQPTASPLRATADELKAFPPTLVITDEHDVLRDEGEAFARRLMEAGVPTTAVRFLGTIHDFVMLNALADSPATRGAIDLACDTLRRAFA